MVPHFGPCGLLAAAAHGPGGHQPAGLPSPCRDHEDPSRRSRPRVPRGGSVTWPTSSSPMSRENVGLRAEYAFSLDQSAGAALTQPTGWTAPIERVVRADPEDVFSYACRYRRSGSPTAGGKQIAAIIRPAWGVSCGQSRPRALRWPCRSRSCRRSKCEYVRVSEGSIPYS